MQTFFAETVADVVEPDRKTGSARQEKPDPVSNLYKHPDPTGSATLP